MGGEAGSGKIACIAGFLYICTIHFKIQVK
jgi:hypothetical protein